MEGARSAGTSTPFSDEARTTQIADLLAAAFAQVLDSDVGAHFAARLDQPGAARIEQHAGHRQSANPEQSAPQPAETRPKKDRAVRRSQRDSQFDLAQ